MSTTPRTIDNLGVDVSNRYARDQAMLDPTFLEESKYIPTQTEVLVTSPHTPSEFDERFDTAKRNIPWAAFGAPPNYSVTKRRLFSYQIVPSLGSPEKQIEEFEKLKTYTAPKKKKKSSTLDIRQAEKEKNSLIHLFETVEFLNNQLVYINQRRNQYHKG